MHHLHSESCVREKVSACGCARTVATVAEIFNLNLGIRRDLMAQYDEWLKETCTRSKNVSMKPAQARKSRHLFSDRMSFATFQFDHTLKKSQ